MSKSFGAFCLKANILKHSSYLGCHILESSTMQIDKKGVLLLYMYINLWIPLTLCCSNSSKLLLGACQIVPNWCIFGGSDPDAATFWMFYYANREKRSAFVVHVYEFLNALDIREVHVQIWGVSFLNLFVRISISATVRLLVVKIIVNPFAFSCGWALIALISFASFY